MGRTQKEISAFYEWRKLLQCCKKRWNWKAAVLTECEECRLSFWPTKKPSIIQQEMVNLKCYHELICKESRRESSFNKWKKHSQTPWGTVDLKHNGRSSSWGFPSMCLSPNSKPFGLFKVSRWSIWDQFIWTKTSSVRRKWGEIFFFLNVKWNGQTKPTGTSRRTNQHNWRFQTLNK